LNAAGLDVDPDDAVGAAAVADLAGLAAGPIKDTGARVSATRQGASVWNPLASSSRMLPVPCGSLMVAFTGLLKVKAKVSFPSPVVSPRMVTGTESTVVPGGNVRVPLVET
jgi:hypothetical protein